MAIKQRKDGSWHIKSSQVDELRELIGLRLDILRQQHMEFLGRPLTRNELSGLRASIGKIYIDKVPQNIENVNAFFRNYDNPKVNMTRGKWPGLKPLSKNQKTGKYELTNKQKRLYRSTSIIDGEITSGPVIRQARDLDRKFGPNNWPVALDGGGKTKSLEGFKKWLNRSYSQAAFRAKILGSKFGVEYHAGHGLSSEDYGINSPSNLADQPGYIEHKGLTANVPLGGDTLKSVEDLQDAGVNIIGKGSRYNISAAFNEYLMEGDTNINRFVGTPNGGKGLTEEWRSRALHDPNITAGAAEIEGRRALLNQALKDNLSRASRTVNTANMFSMTVAQAAAGNVIGAGVTGTLAAGSLTLQNSAVVQKRIAKILAARAGKSAAKFVPGVDIAISAAEAGGYISEGKWDQATIAALSGALGWIPVAGDLIAGGLDSINTGIDISRMDFSRGEDIKNDIKLDADSSTNRSNIRNFTGAADYVDEVNLRSLRIR
tara:strand:- start:542 stop:2008 length:1467 start_codon:yes stop_codon:yes gene_type:complete